AGQKSAKSRQKQKRPAGRFFIKSFSNILEKRRQLQMRFYAMLGKKAQNPDKNKNGPQAVFS
uniref:hypothetical protein n=1 Tax=Shigella sp. FC1139 TaxID=1892899 RepID=UPI0013140A16